VDNYRIKCGLHSELYTELINTRVIHKNENDKSGKVLVYPLIIHERSKKS